ncbi:MAG: nucleoside 2-deoxyribosyltransferase [Paracoccaceae bacterium]|nr:MAG: nucleoside 2-deoxyribosyltransferase [Paracoccaceae bacterium]
MTKKIYIAGPLFNTHEKGYLEKIAIELESNGFECFLPHRDQKDVTEEELKQLNMSNATKEKIFNNDLNALKTSDLTVALLTGQDIDSGTAAEIGFSYANKKPIIAITASERRFRNLFVEGMIDKTIDEIDTLVDTIKNLKI